MKKNKSTNLKKKFDQVLSKKKIINSVDEGNIVVAYTGNFKNPHPDLIPKLLNSPNHPTFIFKIVTKYNGEFIGFHPLTSSPNTNVLIGGQRQWEGEVSYIKSLQFCSPEGIFCRNRIDDLPHVNYYQIKVRDLVYFYECLEVSYNIFLNDN